MSKLKKIGGLAFFSVFLIILASAVHATDEKNLWHALRSGEHFALMRHAVAPGTGDPANFTIGQCATQRNLSGEGRDQARKIGERFRENKIDSARVFSSQWCRCLETAQLLDLGPVEELPALNSFFRRFERQASQTGALKQWLLQQDLSRPLVLVTHQVNITALTGIYPASGELVIVRRTREGGFESLGSIMTR